MHRCMLARVRHRYRGGVLIDEGSELGARVARRLREETVVWLTTVAPSGAPLPRPVGFLWDGGGGCERSASAFRGGSGSRVSTGARTKPPCPARRGVPGTAKF